MKSYKIRTGIYGCKMPMIDCTPHCAARPVCIWARKRERDWENALGVDRLQFAFTITFHYIFPQLTMGLALLILILKTIALRR